MWKVRQVVQTAEQRKEEKRNLILARFSPPPISLPSAPTELDYTVQSEVDQDYYGVSCLGSGEYAVVIEAIHKRHHKRVAIKVMTLGAAAHTERERAAREVRINGFITHPNIAKVFCTYRKENEVCLVMEHMSGGSLKNKVSAKGPLPEEKARVWMRGVLNALNYLHGLQIAHRDLKPENLIFERSDENYENNLLKIIDFGFAKQESRLNRLTSSIGTPNYCAPEVMATTVVKTYTNAVDMWSIGCIIFYMLTATMPFSAGKDDTEQESLFKKSKEGKYSYPEGLVISLAAQDIISACIQVKAKKRLTAQEALKHHWITGHKDDTKVDNAAVNVENMKGPVETIPKESKGDL